MDHFTWKDGVLHAEDVPLPAIAAEAGTPVYVYSTATIERHYRLFAEALAGLPHLICYAVKANSNQAVLATLARLGAGMDVVSGGEYARARAAGVPGERIVFSGVGKTDAEIEMALRGGIRQLNVESEPELEDIDRIVRRLGVRAPIAFRVNPDVDPRTHEKIATGKAENKFGVPIADASRLYARAAAMAGVEIVGVDVHIGSQLIELEPFRIAFERVADLTRRLRAEGHPIRRVDLGGGLGIPYTASNEIPPLPADYGALIRSIFAGLDVEVEIEPGRLIVGNAGVLLASVIRVKEGADRRFVILDAAMNDLVRPALYDAHHDIVTVRTPEPGAPREPADIVGPVCETGDTFARARALPPLGKGDLVAFRSAGAYGAVMASEYNTRPLVPEVMVKGDQFAVIRPRPSLDEIIARDRLPPWMSDADG